MALPIIQSPTFTYKDSQGRDIKYRPFTVKEQKNLLITAEGGDNADILRGIVDLVNACTFQKHDWMSGLAVDLELAFLNIRAKSVGEVVELSYICKHHGCEQRNHADVDIRAATHQSFPNPLIQVTDDIAIQFDHLTVADVIAVTSGMDNLDLIFKKTKMVIHGEQVITEFTKEEFKTFLESFPPQASDAVDQFFKNQPTLILEVPTHCLKCHHESKITLKGVLNFFG